MNIRRAGVLALGILLVSRVAAAQTQDKCTKGDCEYRFDDEDLNAPGWSPYGEWLGVHKIAPKVGLIRPRISFIMEMLKTTENM